MLGHLSTVYTDTKNCDTTTDKLHWQELQFRESDVQHMLANNRMQSRLEKVTTNKVLPSNRKEKVQHTKFPRTATGYLKPTRPTVL